MLRLILLVLVVWFMVAYGFLSPFLHFIARIIIALGNVVHALAGVVG